MRWLELSVEVDVEAVEPVSEIFGRLGRGAAVRPTRLIRDPADELAVREDPAAPFVVTAHLPDDDQAPRAIDDTERALWHLQAFGLRPIGPLRLDRVDDADWAEAWKADYRPQRIGRVVVVPSWLDEEVRADEAVLRLDPGMAFGTGLHPSTRGCLMLLQSLDPPPASVLDVGCGSGILAIAALTLGAAHATCLDTDPVAVESTRANAAANGFGARLDVRRGTLVPQAVDRYPMVLANLVAAVLVELAPALAAHTDEGGALIAGGIIAPRAGEVEEALAAAGFGIRQRLEEGDWVSLHAMRA